MASINRLWRAMLGVEGIVVVGWEFDEHDEVLRVAVRPVKRGRRRCSVCRQRCALYDQGRGVRSWRSLDVGTIRVFLDAVPVRVECPEHGVVSAEVPWGARDSRFTYDFEHQCAWLCAQTHRTAVSALMRVSWRTVGRIVDRVAQARLTQVDPLDGVRRLAIDELSYRKRHKYVTAVFDLDSKRLIWMAKGRRKETVDAFFDELGEARSRQIEVVSADAAGWIDTVVRKRTPQATRCMDPFHVVKWATDAVDKVRREVWNELRRAREPGEAKDLKGARWVLLKNPANLSDEQQTTLARIQKDNARLYRAYLLKEGLRSVFHAEDFEQARVRLEQWLGWACRCRIPAFVKVARTVREQRERIEAALRLGVSNALAEGRNTQLRVIQRMAFGFRDVQSFIGLALLKLGGLCPALPGRE